tara:strand:+ start:355 stop:774 length:420 start_codon:yes stop_codon:yes gene_type:complete
MFVTSCGYQPLYVGIDAENTVFNKISLKGNKNINRKIISAISLKEDKNGISSDEIVLTSKREIKETSKDSKGQILTFKMILQLNVKILNNQKVIKERNFLKEFSYNNKENKFDLSEYQNRIENNLIDKLIEELIIFIKT